MNIKLLDLRERADEENSNEGNVVNASAINDDSGNA